MINIVFFRAKNHPKLYLWSKPWEKLPLPEQQEIKEEAEEIIEAKGSMLLSLLRTGKEEDKIKNEIPEFPKLDLNTLIDNNMEIPNIPNIPQPEAAIDSADCRINLLEHISHSQSLIEQRLSDFENQIKLLDVGNNILDSKDDDNKLRQTTQMILRDLNTLKELSVCSSI